MLTNNANLDFEALKSQLEAMTFHVTRDGKALVIAETASQIAFGNVRLITKGGDIDALELTFAVPGNEKTQRAFAQSVMTLSDAASWQFLHENTMFDGGQIEQALKDAGVRDNDATSIQNAFAGLTAAFAVASLRLAAAQAPADDPQAVFAAAIERINRAIAADADPLALVRTILEAVAEVLEVFLQRVSREESEVAFFVLRALAASARDAVKGLSSSASSASATKSVTMADPAGPPPSALQTALDVTVIILKLAPTVIAGSVMDAGVQRLITTIIGALVAGLDEVRDLLKDGTPAARAAS